MSNQIITGILSADVAAAGTFTATIPSGYTLGAFKYSQNHQLVMAQNPLVIGTNGFSISFSGTTATITNNTAATWPAGSAFTLALDLQGDKAFVDPITGFAPVNTSRAFMFRLDLGAPAALSSTGLVASADFLLGVNALSSTATLDVPRNVTAAWTGTAVCTVVGTDVYGNAMTEASASGPSLTGKKAFKTVSSISFSANVTSATAGYGKVLGLPMFLPSLGVVIKELEDGAVVGTGGTIVAGVVSKATTTTGDVRGTVSPNSNPDGAKTFELIVALTDPGYRGVTQA